MTNDNEFGEMISSEALQEGALPSDIYACKRLWASMLLTMIRDYAKLKRRLNKPPTKKLRGFLKAEGSSAEAWLFMDNSKDIGSFAWVCATLDINIEPTRKRIKENLRNVNAFKIIAD